MPHRRGIALTLVTLGALLVAVTTLTPTPGTAPMEPFCVLCGGGVDLVLNGLLFLPLGIGLALLGLSPTRTATLAGAASLLIETAQYTVIVGRHASVRDILTNTAGAWLGALVVARWGELSRPSPRRAAQLGAVWGAMWVLLQVTGGALQRISTEHGRYYGHVGRAFDGERSFDGVLVEASVAGVPAVDDAFADSAAFRDRFLRPPLVVTASIRSDVAPTDRFGPLLRVVDDRRNELVRLGLFGRAIVFAPRTLAARVRLRPLLFFVDHVLPARMTAPGQRDTIRFVAEYGRQEVLMRARAGDIVHESRYTLTPSTTWTLIFPFQIWAPDPEVPVLTSLWLAALLAPVGYWLAWAAGRGRSAARRAVAAAAAGVALLTLGLVAAPLATGLRPCALWEWCAAAVGLTVGGVAAWRRGRKDAAADPGAVRGADPTRILKPDQLEVMTRGGEDGAAAAAR